jgi:hypothetical protein
MEGSPSFWPRDERGLDMPPEDGSNEVHLEPVDEEDVCLLPDPPMPELRLVPERHPERHGGDDPVCGHWTLGGPSRESQKLHRLELFPIDPTASFEAVDMLGNVIIAIPRVDAPGTVGINGGKSVNGRALLSAYPHLDGMCRWLPKLQTFEFRLGLFSDGPLIIRKCGEPSAWADLGRVLAVAPARRRRARAQTVLPDGRQNPGQMQGDHPT